MRLFDTILISLVVVLFVIGIHQTFVVGFFNSYWIFMFMLILLYWVQLRKKPKQENVEQQKKPLKNKSSKRK